MQMPDPELVFLKKPDTRPNPMNARHSCLHRTAWVLLASLLMVWLSACSPPADQAETTWHEREAEVVGEIEPEPPGDGRPMLSQFSDDEIAAIRESSDQAVMQIAEADLACGLIESDELTEILGGEWTEGRFRWFETELQIAPAALRGVCVWQQLEHRTSLTLRVYDYSELAWASLLQHDDRFARRFYDRPLADGPAIGHDAYRKPMGADGHDGSCVALDDYIVCMTASARHTEQWTEDDTRLLGLVIERLE
jgi:hypothetical protein